MMDFGIRSRFQGAQRFYLLDFLGENLQKSCTRRAVDHLMIARERQADGVDDCYATVLPHRLKLDRVHAENRYLRRLRIGVKDSIPKLPRLLTVNVAPRR